MKTIIKTETKTIHEITEAELTELIKKRYNLKSYETIKIEFMENDDALDVEIKCVVTISSSATDSFDNETFIK